MTHAVLSDLEACLPHVRVAPADRGPIELIVCRPEPAVRQTLHAAELVAGVGLVGDCWLTRGSSTTDDGAANPDAEVTIMGTRAAAAIIGDRGGWEWAGDQLYADLDLSLENLPPGTVLQVGSARLEVTALPHRGCGKFLRRFGADAMKFVNSEAGRALNLRGINTRILSGGTVRVGDQIEVSRTG